MYVRISGDHFESRADGSASTGIAPVLSCTSLLGYRRAMSELSVTVARPGIPGFIGAWPQSRLWLLCVDLYPALAAASLPWSTTAVSIFMVLWLLVVLPTVRWPEF